jgi:hypothetical protein
MYKQRLILFIAMFLGASGAIAALRPVAAAPVTTTQEFWSAKTHLGEGAYDLVAVGDSRTLMGISPAAMQDVLPGRKILNFGYLNAALTPKFLEAAVAKLDAAASDRMLVIGVTPLSLSAGSLGNAHFNQELNRRRREPLDPEFEEEVRRVFSPFELFAAKKAGPGSGTDFREAGWLASHDKPADPKIALESYTRHFTRGTFDEANFELLLSVLTKTIDSGVRIVAFRHPSTRAMEDLESRMSGFREEYVRQHLSDVGVTWIPLKSKRGLSLEFGSYDGSHLNPKGAVFFSSMLAGKIAKLD